jgi:N-succinyl-L-ornithine transcarbamylase
MLFSIQVWEPFEHPESCLNLGMNVMVMNFTNEGWSFEFENGAIMNRFWTHQRSRRSGLTLWYYCCKGFCRISRQGKDNAETVLLVFKFATVPIVNMEGCTDIPSGTSRCDNHGRTQNRTQTESVLSWAHTLKFTKPWQIPVEWCSYKMQIL